MTFYHALPSFDDAAPAWHDLNEIQGVDCWVLSNGTHEVYKQSSIVNRLTQRYQMVTAGLRAASLEFPKSFVIAPDVQRYKPSMEIYQALLKKAGKEETPQDVYLLSRFAACTLISRSTLIISYHPKQPV